MRLGHALSLPSTLPLSAASWSGSLLGSGPTSRGTQVAVLRLHVVFLFHVTYAAYSWERGGRITQLQYLLHLFFANF